MRGYLGPAPATFAVGYVRDVWDCLTGAAPGAYDQVYGGGIPPGEVTHDLLAGAAGFEAVCMYEHHRGREGIAEHHALGKELLAGLAAAETDKHLDCGR